MTSSGAYFGISVSLLRIIFRQENGLRQRRSGNGSAKSSLGIISQQPVGFRAKVINNKNPRKLNSAYFSILLSRAALYCNNNNNNNNNNKV